MAASIAIFAVLAHPSRQLRQRFRDPPGHIQIHFPEPRDFVDVSLICILGIFGIPRLKLNNLPKRSSVEKLLPCMEYLLKRTHRIRVHLVGDLPKAIIEVTDGPTGRFQPRRCCVLV